MDSSDFIPNSKFPKRQKSLNGLRKIVTLCGALLLVFFLWYVLTLGEAPRKFPVDTIVRIPEGATIQEVSDLLDEQNIVRSSLYMYILLQSTFGDEYIQAGNYQFTKPLTSNQVATAITKGEYTVPSTVVTFPEGFRIADMPRYLPDSFDHTNLDDLQDMEGYLFPDTYFLREDDTLADLQKRMEENFAEKIAILQDEIERSPYTLSEIIILASILEREANDEESMRTVAGILENRLEIGMALQVDATLEYLLGRGSHELTVDDLDIDSPYNTYEYTGLPPTPIANPGLDAIRAVLNPIKNGYFYYLTGNDGKFYYAEDFEEHKRNRALYLD